MREFWGKVTTYLGDKHNLRKVVIASAAVFLLLGVVLFSADIGKLLNLPWGIRAQTPGGPKGSDTNWTNLPPLANERSNAKLIDVVDSAGDRWLYAIGGLTGGQRINLVNKVERIQINNDTDPANLEMGKPIGNWQSVADMNFGHAEFGLVVYKDFIAVIAGDIHATKIGTSSLDEIRTKEFPLIYSTIEILNYKDPAPTWQVYALLSGVNFYPEVVVIGDQLHIVGGVYGNPFVSDLLFYPGGGGPGTKNYYRNYYTGSLLPFSEPWDLMARDPLMLEADFLAWDDPVLDLAHKRIVGGTAGAGVPLTIDRGGIGGLITDPDHSNPNPPEPLSPPGGWGDDALDNWGLTFTKNNDLGFSFSEWVLSGAFHTTISEHYILDLTKNPALDDSFVVQTGELGLDYTLNQPVTVWSLDQVVSFGHLKLHAYVGYRDHATGGDFVVNAIAPAPQGRYGHKLIIHDGYLLVLGGASWSTSYKSNSHWDEYMDPDCEDACLITENISGYTRSHFWVIDDEIDPFTNNSLSGYQYVGNIAYMWNPILQRWDSTNADMASFPSRKLANGYAFKSPDGDKKGRAFFGLAEMDFSETMPPTNNYRVAVAVGGLQNKPDAQPSDYFWREVSEIGVNPSYDFSWFSIPVEVTNRTEKIVDDVIGWENQPDGYVDDGGEPIKTYNLSSIGIDKYRSISFDGQLKFQDEIADPSLRIRNPVHVPDYQRTGNEQSGLSDGNTSMLVGDEWWAMPTSGEDNLMNYLTFSAVKDVRVVDNNGKTTVYIYKVGGVTGPDSGQEDWLPLTSAAGQYLGPFTYGQPGEPDLGTSTFIVEPSTVKADGVSYATATLTLLDYYEDPVPGYKAIVATNNNSSWPPVDTDNVLIKPFDTTQQPAGDPWPSPWLVTNVAGEAKFRLTSVKELSDLVCVYVSEPEDTSPPDPKPEDPYMPECLPITFAGGVSYLNSTIDADPIKVAADGIEYSTVTVTLLDHQSPPQPVADRAVKIISSRNSGSNENNFIDKIQVLNAVTDSSGQAKFKVSSSTRGKAIISARYSKDAVWDDNNYGEVIDTATIEFGPMIRSLEPDNGKQGQTLPQVIATGAGTHWDSTNTKVEFIPPSGLSFLWQDQNGNDQNIEDLYLSADDLSIVKIGIWTDKKQTATSFSITNSGDEGDQGNFWPLQGDGNSFNTTTGDDGRASFSYECGSTPGLVKISATVGGLSDELWLVLRDPLANVYDMDMIADPSVLEHVADASVIKARIYRYVDNAKVPITTPLSFHFVTDGDGTLSEDEDMSDGNGIAETQYTRDATVGRIHVFAWAEYQTYKIFGRVTIHQKGISQITIGSVTIPIDGGGIHLTANNVAISPAAALGFWIFRTTTRLSTAPGDSLSSEEVADYPFQVLPFTPTGVKLTDINPWIGIRGTNNLEITIMGENTHFYNGTSGDSVVSFTPVNSSDSSGIEVLADTLAVSSDTQLKITINVRSTATVGFWNVKVTTGSEVAEMAGDSDFLVSDDQKGYFINLYAKPDIIIRDGQKQSLVEAHVGKTDLWNGEIHYIDGLTVTFDKANDEGKLSANSAITQNGGVATVQYTTDAGEENDYFIMTATTSPETNIWISAKKRIDKVVRNYIYHLTAKPTEIPLNNAPDQSDLSINDLPKDQRIPITLHFDNNPKGHIEPAATTSSIDGTARSTYLAAPRGQRVTEIVRIYAVAVIPDYGQVRSNIAEIQIGRDASKYRIDVVAVPDSVIAGSTQRSTITATLRFQTQVVEEWPITFALIEAASGDSLTILSGETNASGVLVTEFVPGNIEGAVIVRAYPDDIPLYGEDTIAKTADKFPDKCRSNISAVSHYVPANGTSYSVVTVTLRNSNYVPIAGQLVTISTNNTNYEVKLANGTTGNSAVTNIRGQAIFRVSSKNTTVGTCMVTATFNAIFDLKTDIIFETPGSLISQNLKLTVPFEMRDYDNLTWIYLTENALTEGYFINEMYTKEASPNNEIKDLTDIVIYLHPNKTYTMWAKGRYHKAKIQTFITGSIGGDPIEINFSAGASDPGLLIGDLLPDTKVIGFTPSGDDITIPTPFHDNYVNAIDAGLFFAEGVWFHSHYLADFNWDMQVNSIDFNMLIRNWGPGAQGAPRPRCDI